MKRWYAVHTQPREELRCVQQLGNQGFEAYAPLYQKLRSHAGRREMVRASLFPGYVFVRLDLERDRWLAVNSTRGARYLVCQGMTPLPLADSVIERLKGQADDNGLVPASVVLSFSPGQKLRIVDGAMAGQECTFRALSDQERVNVLLSLLGREVSIDLPAEAVEVA